MREYCSQREQRKIVQLRTLMPIKNWRFRPLTWSPKQCLSQVKTPTNNQGLCPMTMGSSLRDKALSSDRMWEITQLHPLVWDLYRSDIASIWITSKTARTDQALYIRSKLGDSHYSAPKAQSICSCPANLMKSTPTNKDRSRRISVHGKPYSIVVLICKPKATGPSTAKNRLRNISCALNTKCRWITGKMTLSTTLDVNNLNLQKWINIDLPPPKN